MTLHRPRRRIGERLLVAVATTVSAGYAALHVVYVALLTAGGHW